MNLQRSTVGIKVTACSRPVSIINAMTSVLFPNVLQKANVSGKAFYISYINPLVNWLKSVEFQSRDCIK